MGRKQNVYAGSAKQTKLLQRVQLILVVVAMLVSMVQPFSFFPVAAEEVTPEVQENSATGGASEKDGETAEKTSDAAEPATEPAAEKPGADAAKSATGGAEGGSSAGTAGAAAEAGTGNKAGSQEAAHAAANEADGNTAADAGTKAGTEKNTGGPGEVPAAADKAEGQTAAEEGGETASEENEGTTPEADEGKETEEAADGDKETEEASADEEDSAASTEEETEDDTDDHEEADDHEDADKHEIKRSSQNGRPAKAPAEQNDPKPLAVYLYKEGQESAGENSEGIEQTLEGKNNPYYLPEGVPLNLLLQLIQKSTPETLKISVTSLSNKNVEDLIDNVHYGLNRNEFTVRVGDQTITLKKDENGSYVFTGSIYAATNSPTSANMETNIYLGGLKGDYGDGIKLSIEYGNQKFESDFAITKRKYNDSISIGGLGNKKKDQPAPYPVVDGGPTDDTPEDGNRVLEETARIVDATVNWGKAPLEKNGEPNKDAFIDPVLRSGQGGDTVALDSLNITVQLPKGKDAKGNPICPEYIKNGKFYYCDNGNGTLTLTLTREQIKKTLSKGADGKYYFCEKGYDSEGQAEGKKVELKQADLNDVVLKNGKDLVYVVKEDGKVKRYAVEEQLVKQLEKSGFYLIGNAIYKKEKPTDTKYTRVAIYQKNEEGKWGFVGVDKDGKPTDLYFDHIAESDVKEKNNGENKTYLTEITAESILHFTEKYQAKYGSVFNKIGEDTETAAKGVREVVGGQTEGADTPSTDDDVTRRNIWVTREESSKDENGQEKTEKVSYYNGTIIDTAKTVILDATKKVVSVINKNFEIIKNALIDEKGERLDKVADNFEIKSGEGGNTVTRDGQDYVTVGDKEYRLVKHAVFSVAKVAEKSVKTFLEGFSWFSSKENSDEKKVNQVGDKALPNDDSGQRLVVDKNDKVQDFTAKKNTTTNKWEFTLPNGTTDSNGKPTDLTVSEDDKVGVSGKDVISVNDKSALIDSNLRKISEKKDDGSYEGYAGVKDYYYYDGKRYVPIGYHYDKTKNIYVNNDGTTNSPSYEQAQKAIKESSQGRYYYKDLIDISLNPVEKEELAEKDAKTLENVTKKTHYSGSTDEKDYVKKGDDGEKIYVRQKDGNSTYFVNVDDGHDILSDQEKKEAIFKICKDADGKVKGMTYLGQGDIYDYYDKYFRHIKLRFPKFLAGPAFAYDADATLSGTYTDPSNKKTKDAISNKDLNEGAELTKATDSKRFTLKNVKPQDQNFGKKRPDEFNNNAKMNFDLFNLLFRSGKGRDGKWRDEYLRKLFITDPAELSAEDAKRLQQIRESFRQRYGAELQWGVLDDGSEGLLYTKKNADGTTTTVEAKRSLDWTIFLNSTAKDGYPEASSNEQLVFYDFHLDPRLVYDAVTFNLPRLFFDTLKHVLGDGFHGDRDYAYLDDVEEVSFGVNPNYQRSRYLQVDGWKLAMDKFLNAFVSALNDYNKKIAGGTTPEELKLDHISSESGLVQGPEVTPLQKFINRLISQPVKAEDGIEQGRNQRYVDLQVKDVPFDGKDNKGNKLKPVFNVRIDTVLGRISIGVKEFFSKNLKDENGKITKETATIGSGENKEVTLKDGYSPVQVAYAQQLEELKTTINAQEINNVNDLKKLREKLEPLLGDAPCGETVLATIDNITNEKDEAKKKEKLEKLKTQLSESLEEMALPTSHMKADADKGGKKSYEFLNRSFNALRITLKNSFKLNTQDNPQTQVKMDINTVIADQVEVPFTDEYGQDLTNYELYLRDEIATLLMKNSTEEAKELGLSEEQKKQAKKIDLTKPDTVDALVQNLSEAQYRKLYSLAHEAMAEKIANKEIKKLVSEEREEYNRARMGKDQDLEYEDLQGYYEKDSEGKAIKSGLREEANAKRKTLINGYFIEEKKNGGWTGVKISDKKYDIQTPALLNQKINLIAYYLQQQGYNGAYFGNEAAYRLQTEKAPATIFNSSNAWKKTRCHDGILPCVVIEGGDAASGKTPGEDEDSDMNVARDRVTITYETSEGPDSENPSFDKTSPRKDETIRINEKSWQNPDDKTVAAFRENLKSNYTNTDLGNLYKSMKKGQDQLIAWNKAASKDGKTEAGAYLSQKQIDMLNGIKNAEDLKTKAKNGDLKDDDLKTIMAVINIDERCIDFSLEMKVDALSKQAKIDHLKLVENKTAKDVEDMNIEGDYNENGYRVVKNGFLFDLIPNGLLPYYTDKDGQIKNTLQMKLNIYYKNLLYEGESSVDSDGKYIGPNKDLFELEDGKLKKEDGKPVLNKESKLYKQLSEAKPVYYENVKSLLEELKKEGEGEGSKYQLLLNSLTAADIDVEKLPEDQQAIIVWLPEFEAPHRTNAQFKLEITGLMASETAQFGKKRNLGTSQIGHAFVPFTLTGEKEGNINKYLRVLDAEGKAITDQLADDKDGWFKGTGTLHFGDKFDYRITYSYQGVSNTSSAGGTDGKIDKFGIKDYLPAYYKGNAIEKILDDIKAKNAAIKDEDEGKLKELLNSGDFSPRLIAPIEIAGSQNEKFKVVYYNAAGDEVLIPSLAKFNAMGDKDKMDLLKKLKEVRSFEIKVKEGYRVSPSAGVDVRLQMQMPEMDIEFKDGKYQLSNGDVIDLKKFLDEKDQMSISNRAFYEKSVSNPVTITLKDETLIKLIKRWKDAQGKDVTPKKEDKDSKGESQSSDGNASEGGNSEAGTGNAEKPASPAKPETKPSFPEVTVEIYRQYKDEKTGTYKYELDENGDRKVYMVVKLNAENGYELTIKDLPRRATKTENIISSDGKNSVGTETVLYSYRYVVRELPVPGYVGTVLGNEYQILGKDMDETGLVRIIENKPEEPEKPEKPREPKEPPTPPTPSEPPKEPRKKSTRAVEQLPKTAAAAKSQDAKAQTEISLQPDKADAADAPQQAQNAGGIGLLLSSLSLVFGAFLLSRKSR